MLNQSPSLPLYHNIKSVIKKRILEGTYPVGGKIPNEHEFSREFGVHRLTVRRALALLVQEGYLQRIRRRGTFVLKPEKEFEELELAGFFDDLLSHVSKFKAKRIEIDQQTPPEMVADHLQLENGKTKVTVIKRVRFLDKVPSAYTVSYLPMEIGKKIQKKDLRQMPLLQIFREKLKIPLGEAFQTIEASIADKDVAQALGIFPGAQILLIQRTFFTKHGQPFDFVQTFYRGDKFRYSVRFRCDDKNHLLLTNG